MRRRKKPKGIIKVIISWLIFIGYINLFPPTTSFSFLAFYFLLLLSLFATFRLFIPVARSIVWIATILIYLILRQNHLENIINTILLLGIFVTLEVYFHKT